MNDKEWSKRYPIHSKLAWSVVRNNDGIPCGESFISSEKTCRIGDADTAVRDQYYHAERIVGDVKEGPRLGTFLTSDPTVASGLAGGTGTVQKVAATFSRPLKIAPNTRKIGSEEAFDEFTSSEINAELKKAGIKFKFSKDLYEDGESVWRMIDSSGRKFTKAVKSAGYDAVQFPEWLQGKNQTTTLVLDAD
jgi:hypothetical protein